MFRIFIFALGENPEFSRFDPVLSIIIDLIILLFFFALVFKLFFVKIHNRKNVLVNYCYTHKSTKGLYIGEKFAHSILAIGKIHLKKGTLKKILVL